MMAISMTMRKYMCMSMIMVMIAWTLFYAISFTQLNGFHSKTLQDLELHPRSCYLINEVRAIVVFAILCKFKLHLAKKSFFEDKKNSDVLKKFNFVKRLYLNYLNTRDLLEVLISHPDIFEIYRHWPSYQVFYVIKVFTQWTTVHILIYHVRYICYKKGNQNDVDPFSVNITGPKLAAHKD